MGVNYAHLRNLTAREIISALIPDGFAFDRAAGSHQVYYHLLSRCLDAMSSLRIRASMAA